MHTSQQAMQDANPRTIDNLGGIVQEPGKSRSFRRDQRPMGAPIARGPSRPCSLSSTGPGGGVASNQTAPVRHGSPRSTPRRAGQAPGGVLAGPRPPARRDGSWMEISCSVIAASPPPSRALDRLSDHPPFFEEESVASHSLRRRARRSLKYTDTHPATLARPPAAPVLLPSFHHRRFSLHHRPGSRCAALSLLRLRDTLSPAPPTSTPFSPSPSRRHSPPSRQHRPNE